MDEKLALIGSGNTFFKDEGVGLYAVKYIKENYTFEPNISIVDGGTLGFKLMLILQEFDDVIIVNTASDDDKVYGDITIKKTDEFLDGDLIKKTANEVEIAEMLQICSLSDKMAETTIISIVPEDIIAVEVGLSESIKCIFHNYVQTVLTQLKKSGIVVNEKEEKISLERILYIFANPSVEHSRGF